MKFHFGRLRSHALTIAAGATMAAASGGVGAQTLFSGTTAGCFYVTSSAPCSPTTASSSFQGLTYNSGSFSQATSNGFLGIGAPPDTLGTFTLSNAAFPSYFGESFRLLVTLTAPAAIVPSGGALFTAALQGSVTSTDNGGVTVDFVNDPLSFTFGSGATAGTFTFKVNDVSLAPNGTAVPVTGQIIAQVSSVPEPETYALFMAGLAAVGFMARRRKA